MSSSRPFGAGSAATFACSAVQTAAGGSRRSSMNAAARMVRRSVTSAAQCGADLEVPLDIPLCGGVEPPVDKVDEDIVEVVTFHVLTLTLATLNC